MRFTASSLLLHYFFIKMIKYSLSRGPITLDTLSLLQDAAQDDSDGEEEDCSSDSSRRIVIFDASSTVGTVSPETKLINILMLQRGLEEQLYNYCTLLLSLKYSLKSFSTIYCMKFYQSLTTRSTGATELNSLNFRSQRPSPKLVVDII